MHKDLSSVWKEFDSIEVTHSIIHYLFSINFLLNERGYARGVDIANNLNITPGSCSISLKNLLKKGLIKEDENKFIYLSDMGKVIVEKTIYKRTIITEFFRDKLGLSEEIAVANACKVEHLLSDEVIEGFKKY